LLLDFKTGKRIPKPKKAKPERPDGRLRFDVRNAPNGAPDLFYFGAGVGIDFHADGDFDDPRCGPLHGVLQIKQVLSKEFRVRRIPYVVFSSLSIPPPGTNSSPYSGLLAGRRGARRRQ
jgi:hypothetical protein